MKKHNVKRLGLAAALLAVALPSQAVVTDDLLTNSQETSPWQDCLGSDLVSETNGSFNPNSIEGDGCAYRETPAEENTAYTFSCGVFSAKYASITLAFQNDNGETLATETTDIYDESLGAAYSVTLTSPPGTTSAAVGIYGYHNSGFHGCTLLLDQPDPGPVDGSIGGLSWFDGNDSATNDPDEGGIEGTPVFLYSDNAVVAEALTDEDGNYYFGGLDLGQCYTVRFESPDPTLELTAQGADSLANAEGFTSEMCLDATTPNVVDVNAGFVAVPPVVPPQDYAVCGTTFLQADGNLGGLADIPVVLKNTDTDEQFAMTSDQDGNFAFGNLGAGNYQLMFEGPSGYEFVTAGAPLTATGSYAGENGSSPVFAIPADANGGEQDACSLQYANAVIEATPVAVEPTVANDDETTQTVGVGFSLDIYSNDEPCDGVAVNLDILGHNVPGNVSYDTQTGELIVSDTTAAGTYSVEYGLRGTCGSYDTATVTIELVDPVPPVANAPDAPKYCRSSVGKTDGTEDGVHVDLIFKDGESAETLLPQYNFYDENGNLVYTGLTSEAGIRSWGIFFRKREHGVEVKDIFSVRSVRDGVESEPTECVRAAVTPIALDTDASGKVDRIHGVFSFDMNGDGTDEQLGEWFSPTDGILISRDFGDTITGLNLFGNAGGIFSDGFAKLSTLDINNDDVVSGSEMANLAIWQDKNSNTQVDAGEISTLASHAITSLPVTHYGYAARAQLENGKTMIMRDLWFPMIPVQQAAR